MTFPSTQRSSHGLAPLALLLLLAGLPDAMVVPVLRDLTVERYGMTTSAAHLFMSASLVGASIVACFATSLRRRFGLRRVVAVSALVNAMLLATMAIPIGAFATIVLRMIEGAADLMVYAVLFDRIAHAGSSERRGARLGMAATLMMVGIALGLLAGGVIGAASVTLPLLIGAGACLVVCAGSAILPRGTEFRPRTRANRSGRAMLAPMVQLFADRASAGLLVTTLPLFLAAHAGMDPRAIGSRVGLIMLIMAVGIWPLGRLVDSVGPVRVRLGASLLFAIGLATLPFSMQSGGLSIIVPPLLGGAAAALFASAVVLASRANRDAGGMAWFYTAGNLGFFVGPLSAAGALSLLGGAQPDTSAYAWIFTGFGVAHVLLTGLSLSPLTRPTEEHAPSQPTVTERRRAA